MQSRYGDPLDAQEYETTEKVVDAHIRNWSPCFAPSDREDLIQECLLHWIKARKAFNNEGGASLRTFQKRVLRNKLHDLAEREQTDKRKVHRDAQSLDETLGGQADGRTRADQVTRDLWKGPGDDYSQADLRLELTEVLKKLTEAQKALVRLLFEGYTVVEISELLNKHRSTICDEMARIRELFEKAGLRGYLV